MTAADKRHPGLIDHHIGARVRLRRQACGVNQAELARRLDVTFQQVQKYERGDNRISAATLHRIATALNVPVQYFYDGLEPGGCGAAAPTANRALSAFLLTAEAAEIAALFEPLKDPRHRRICVDMLSALTAGLEAG